MPWYDLKSINEPPLEFLQRTGEILQVFDEHTQDSGNISYGLQADGRRYFVKMADPEVESFSPLSERIERLRNAAMLRRSITTSLIPDLHAAIESPYGPLLVYAWAPGQILYADRDRRSEPDSAYRRFCALPSHRIIAVLDRTYALHTHLAEAGWLASDFYDGCFLYDFENHDFHLVDLDHYHRGPYTNTQGRMPGSTRFMAPEEFRLGATIDERTTVFNLARAALAFLADGHIEPDRFRGTDRQHAVLRKACADDPDARFQTLADFYAAWRQASGSTPNPAPSEN